MSTLLEDLRTLAMVNYGHFTSMRVDRGRVRGLGRHLDRLERDAREVFGRAVPADVVRDDAIFVDRRGEISEATVSNVCFADGDTLVWSSALALPGVAMHLLRDALAARGVPVATRPVRPADLPSFRAAFASNALAPVQVIEQVDDVRFAGDDDLRTLLTETYEAIPEEAL
jgi:branched-subunit amino acid aminotransferase/4-amino-4-deoxychorismate lyase